MVTARFMRVTNDRRVPGQSLNFRQNSNRSQIQRGNTLLRTEDWIQAPGHLQAAGKKGKTSFFGERPWSALYTLTRTNEGSTGES